MVREPTYHKGKGLLKGEVLPLFHSLPIDKGGNYRKITEQMNNNNKLGPKN